MTWSDVAIIHTSFATSSSSHTMSNLVEITSPEHFKQVLSEDLNRVSVLDFWASWAKPCEKMNEAVKEMSHKYSEVLFLMVSLAEDVWSRS